MKLDMLELWEEASRIDPTLRGYRQGGAALLKKQIHLESFSRERLFSRMSQGQVSLFSNCPVFFKDGLSSRLPQTLADRIITGFPASQTARVQTGPSRTIYRLKVPEVMRRWQASRALVGVTDLHFRGTQFEKAIDYSALNDFDVLCSDPELIETIEILSLVISSRGTFTDSHADDCDGSNHCFIGKKLWLAWDRIEGKAKGFQDVDRDQVRGKQARFDLRTFLSLRSASWFVVEANHTLFLPGHLAHKVITLAPYIGIGGFYASMPGYLRSLTRWLRRDTLDIGPKGLLEKINRAMLNKMSEVRSGSRRLQERWGLAYLQKAIQDWERTERPSMKKSLMKNPSFAAFVQTALASMPIEDT
jgi:hypothetical protein